ncbi:MAG: Hsp20/alpha crystallin family protein [Nitrospinota bacterium]|nr:Hsp20/alpha crystallin family protein [Nitrospinota bacterium]
MSLNELIPWHWGKNGESLRRDSGNPFAEFQKEMNRMFDNFSESMFSLSPLKRSQPEISAAYPRMDVSETDKEFKISAELPGMDEKDIDVSVSNDLLTIKGEKKAEKEEKKKNYYRMERSYGAFQRSIPLPAEVEKDRVQANFKKGVLNIVLPKSEKAIKESKKVEIKSND